MTETTSQALCPLDEIPDGEAKGFTVEHDGGPQQILVVRRGSAVFGYLNICPHLGTPLNFRPDDFMDADTGNIACSTHMAEFRIEDGYCLNGPCKDESLTKIPVKIEAGQVVLG